MKIPTHFRFKNKEEANHWGHDTKTWLQISNIDIYSHSIDISTPDFAYVSYINEKDNLEFKNAPVYICTECGTQLCTEYKGLCAECKRSLEEGNY